VPATLKEKNKIGWLHKIISFGFYIASDTFTYAFRLPRSLSMVKKIKSYANNARNSSSNQPRNIQNPNENQPKMPKKQSALLEAMNAPAETDPKTNITNSEAKFCVICNLPSTASCSKCGRAHYCSREHQVQDWKTHKARCGAVSKTDCEHMMAGRILLKLPYAQKIKQLLLLTKTYSTHPVYPTFLARSLSNRANVKEANR